MSSAQRTEQPNGQKQPNGKKARLKALRWTITLLVVGVVGYFFARSLIDNWNDFQAHQLRFDWGWVLGALLFALAVPLTGIVWARTVRAVQQDVPISTAEAVAVQSLSWILKYIPGQVGSVANKVLWAKKKGISRALIIISFVYENVFLQLASIVPAAIILLLSLGPSLFGDNLTVLALPLLVLIPMALILHRPLFHQVISLPAKKVLKQDVPRSYFLSTGQSLRASVEFMGPRVVNGVGFVFIAVSVSDIGADQWLPFAAAYVLAGAVGILAIFVPSGLGVRELVMVVILTQYIPAPEAILISLLARLLSTIGDLLVAAIYLVTRRTIPKEIRP